MKSGILPYMAKVFEVDVFLRLPHYHGADKSLARPTSRYILFDGKNIYFDASLFIYIYK
jgi:hypothetical protein